MSPVRMVILDFDGTLADTAAVIIRTMQATISQLGLPSRTDEQCAAMIGLRLVEIPSVLFPECSIDGDMYARTYRRLFHEFNKALSSLSQAAGAMPLLQSMWKVADSHHLSHTSWEQMMLTKESLIRNAGTRTCGVTYGNGSRESLCDADWLIDDFGKLLDIIII